MPRDPPRLANFSWMVKQVSGARAADRMPPGAGRTLLAFNPYTATRRKSAMAPAGCEAVARMTLPSAIVGGTAFANEKSSGSLQICLSVSASKAARRPGCKDHCASPLGIDVQTIPFLFPLADSELYPPGMPSVGGFASEPVAVSKGVSPTFFDAISNLNPLRKSFSGISYTKPCELSTCQ